MGRHVCWDSDLVQRYFTTEASTKASRDDFLRLHMPINRMRVVDSKPMVFPESSILEEDGKRFTSEEGLLAAIQSSRLRDPNRIFVVVGEPGAGKSHLARWIEYSLESSPVHLPIHIPRHIDTLDAVIRRLEEVIGITVPARPSTQALDTPPDKLVRFILASLDMEFGKGTPAGRQDPQLATLVDSKAFHALIEQQIARYQMERRQPDGGVKTREILELGSQAFADLLKQLGHDPATDLARREYDRLSISLHRILRRLVNLDSLDLKRLMADISDRCIATGRRPVLVLEDVTSFDLLHDDLMMFLLDESAGHFDALVCWTTGFEQNYMQTYQEQRYTARLALSDDHQETYMLKDGRCVDLVRRYLEAARIGGSGACPYCARTNGLFDGLYPFNTQFVQRIYDNLITTDHQQRRTPRHLLDRAIKAYLELAERDGSFPPLKQPDHVQDIFYDTALYRYRDEYPSFVALMAWYGEPDDGALVLKRAVARNLGVAIPGEFAESETIRIPLARRSREQSELRVAQKDLELSNRFKRLRLELQSWYNLGTSLDHYAELQRGVQKTLQLFRHKLPLTFSHPAGASGIGRPLVYGRDSGEANIFIRRTRMLPQRLLQFEVGPEDPILPEEQNYLLLETMLALQLFGTYPTDTNFALVDHWAQVTFARFRQQVEARLVEGLGMDIGSFLFLAKFLLLNRYAGLATVSDPLDFVKPLGSPTPNELAPAEIDYDPLLRLATTVDDALQALFFISKEFLDYPRLTKAVQRFDLSDLIERATAITLNRIDEDFRFAGGVRLRDLSRAVRATCHSLRATDVHSLFQATSDQLRQTALAADVEPRHLIQRVEELNERIGLYSMHDIYDAALWRRWYDAVDQLSSSMPDGFSDLRSAIEAILLEPGDIHAYLAWVHQASELLRRPDYRVVRTALELCDSVEAGLKGDMEQHRDEYLDLVIDRAAALSARLPSAGDRP